MSVFKVIRFVTEDDSTTKTIEIPVQKRFTTGTSSSGALSTSSTANWTVNVKAYIGTSPSSMSSMYTTTAKKTATLKADGEDTATFSVEVQSDVKKLYIKIEETEIIVQDDDYISYMSSGSYIMIYTEDDDGNGSFSEYSIAGFEEVNISGSKLILWNKVGTPDKPINVKVEKKFRTGATTTLPTSETADWTIYLTTYYSTNGSDYTKMGAATLNADGTELNFYADVSSETSQVYIKYVETKISVGEDSQGNSYSCASSGTAIQLYDVDDEGNLSLRSSQVSGFYDAVFTERDQKILLWNLVSVDYPTDGVKFYKKDSSTKKALGDATFYIKHWTAPQVISTDERYGITTYDEGDYESDSTTGEIASFSVASQEEYQEGLAHKDYYIIREEDVPEGYLNEWRRRVLLRVNLRIIWTKYRIWRIY